MSEEPKKRPAGYGWNLLLSLLRLGGMSTPVPTLTVNRGSRGRISKWLGEQHKKHAYRRGFRSPFERRSNIICINMRAARQRVSANRAVAPKAIKPAFV